MTPRDLSRLTWDQLERLDGCLVATVDPTDSAFCAVVAEMFRRDVTRAAQYLRWRHLVCRFYAPEETR